VSFDPNQRTTPEPFSPAAPEPSGAPGVQGVPTSPVVPSSVGSPAAPIVVAKKGGSSGRLLNIVLAAAVAVAIGGVAFAVGRTTAPVSAATGAGRGGFGGAFPGGSFAPRASGQPGLGRGGFGGGAGGALTVTGTVVSVAGDTLTIKTASGQTIEVSTGTSTTYNTQTPGSASDVQAGKTVQVSLDFAGGGAGRPNASSSPSGPIGTAGSVTVVP
jgi:hypothetical protein